jgi:hypothetical protein
MVLHQPWLRLTAPGEEFESTNASGKWLILRDRSAIDDAWLDVLTLVSTGAVLCAKVSTLQSAVLGGFPQHVICVYTRNWRARKDVLHTREVLRSAGFVEVLRYKRDADTARGVERFVYEA